MQTGHGRKWYQIKTEGLLRKLPGRSYKSVKSKLQRLRAVEKKIGNSARNVFEPPRRRSRSRDVHSGNIDNIDHTDSSGTKKVGSNKKTDDVQRYSPQRANRRLDGVSQKEYSLSRRFFYLRGYPASDSLR
ncbi:hypothetical protein SBOR_9122 [Sclerotinia borealis F-4128]|uniref:Uncharacterized protein n=1 Tax=Sclerotinia borealis (strain F-4128) TaxID=1432307 RepID=W9C114_SCLBF|nr:hypothetical protein SBOR_9122 [Sclerotinia borealis F-4128]